MTFRTCLVWLLLLTAVRAAAHGQEAQEDAAVNPAQEATVPTPLRGGSLSFTDEVERSNYLYGGFSIQTTFDDNALHESTNGVSNFDYSILPYIELKQSRGRLQWALDYAAGLAINQRLSVHNQQSHDLGFETRYRLSPHVDLAVRDHFLMTTGFFDELNENTNIGSGSILQQPNQFVVTPLAQQTSNVATAQLSYQFSASSLVGARGMFYLSRYANAPAGANLVDTDTQEAEGFYNRRISARGSIGVAYRFQRLTFSPITDQTFVHSMFAIYTLQLQPTATLSLFGGPQYADVNTQSVDVIPVRLSQRSWSGAGGASLNWNGKRNSFTAQASRMISDGGGLSGSVQLTSVGAAVRRQLSLSYIVALAAEYGLSNSISHVSPSYSSLKSATGSLSITRRLNNQLGMTVGYAYEFQQTVTPGSSTINHNRAWVSISYAFSQPLGR